MSGAAFLRLKKMTGTGIWQKAARHNKRAIKAELSAAGSIDSSRSHLNETLMGPSSPEAVANAAWSKIEQAGINKPRKDAVVGVELVFSLPKGHQHDAAVYFTACAQWAGIQFGGLDNIVSVDLHRDEAQEHAHVLLVPLIEGRLRGSDAVGNKRRLSELQAKFFEQVASAYGFRKPQPCLRGADKIDMARRVINRLREDPAAKSAAWAVIRDNIERDPLPYALSLNIPFEGRVRPMKTMAQIFTSKGKGSPSKVQVDVSQKTKPYRLSKSGEVQTLGLCRVAVIEEVVPLLGSRPHAVEDGRVRDEVTIRVRESEYRADQYDPECGEFREATQPSHARKHAAKQWVYEALMRRR